MINPVCSADMSSLWLRVGTRRTVGAGQGKGRARAGAQGVGGRCWWDRTVFIVIRASRCAGRTVERTAGCQVAARFSRTAQQVTARHSTGHTTQHDTHSDSRMHDTARGSTTRAVFPGNSAMRILIQGGRKGLLPALDSDAALHTAWARRTGKISLMCPRSAWVAVGRRPIDR